MASRASPLSVTQLAEASSAMHQTERLIRGLGDAAAPPRRGRRLGELAELGEDRRQPGRGHDDRGGCRRPSARRSRSPAATRVLPRERRRPARSRRGLVQACPRQISLPTWRRRRRARSAMARARWPARSRRWDLPMHPSSRPAQTATRASRRRVAERLGQGSASRMSARRRPSPPAASGHVRSVEAEIDGLLASVSRLSGRCPRAPSACSK